MTPAEIQNVMYTSVQPYNVIQAVLQQEVVLYCGRLIATNPSMFTGILKIRVGWVLEAMRIYLQISGQQSIDLDNLSPYQVRILLQKVLTVSAWAAEEKLTTLQRRQLEGCLCRVPTHFYNKIWEILQRNVERRQITVELLCIIATILNRNPELHFKQPLDLDDILSEAFAMYCKDIDLENADKKDMAPFYALVYAQTTGYLARAAVNKVLQGGALSTQEEEVNGLNADHLHHDKTCKVS